MRESQLLGTDKLIGTEQRLGDFFEMRLLTFSLKNGHVVGQVFKNVAENEIIERFYNANPVLDISRANVHGVVKK